MSLADYKPATEVVNLPGGVSFTVRGLSLDDVGSLMKNHLEDLDKLLRLFKERGTNELIADGASAAIRLVQGAPVFAAQMIAIASDEPGAVEQAGKLTVPVQIDAIKKVLKLTFQDAGGLKKFFESLTNSELMAAISPQTDSPT
jgi:hypothetical protein